MSNGKDKNGGPETSASGLKTIVRSLEQGITEEGGRRLTAAIEELHSRFSGDRILGGLVKMAGVLGRHAVANPPSAEKESIPLLISVCDRIDEITATPELSFERRKEMLAIELAKFNELKARIAAGGKMPPVGPDDISDLKAVVLSLEWEITEQTVRKLEEEVARLSPLCKEDKVLGGFLQMILSVGRYVGARRAAADPDSITLLHSVFRGLETVTGSPASSLQEKKGVLSGEHAKFNAFKKKIAAGGAAAGRRDEGAAGGRRLAGESPEAGAEPEYRELSPPAPGEAVLPDTEAGDAFQPALSHVETGAWDKDDKLQSFRVEPLAEVDAGLDAFFNEDFDAGAKAGSGGAHAPEGGGGEVQGPWGAASVTPLSVDESPAVAPGGAERSGKASFSENPMDTLFSAQEVSPADELLSEIHLKVFDEDHHPRGKSDGSPSPQAPARPGVRELVPRRLDYEAFPEIENRLDEFFDEDEPVSESALADGAEAVVPYRPDDAVPPAPAGQANAGGTGPPKKTPREEGPTPDSGGIMPYQFDDEEGDLGGDGEDSSQRHPPEEERLLVERLKEYLTEIEAGDRSAPPARMEADLISLGRMWANEPERHILLKLLNSMGRYVCLKGPDAEPESGILLHSVHDCLEQAMLEPESGDGSWRADLIAVFTGYIVLQDRILEKMTASLPESGSGEEQIPPRPEDPGEPHDGSPSDSMAGESSDRAAKPVEEENPDKGEPPRERRGFWAGILNIFGSGKR